MKVLMINGSPRNEGNTTIALEEMRKVFEKNSVEVEIIQIGQMATMVVYPVIIVIKIVNVLLMILLIS